MKMMNNIITGIKCLSVALLLFPATSKGQSEVLVPVTSNQQIKTALQHREYLRTGMVGPDTLKLPFFDDFNEYSVWPDANLWTDSSAFINYNFPINPPTLGVATFDGLDFEGNPYNNSNVNAAGLCDELTSKPIDLFADENGFPYLVSDSLFLTFYFQRKGRGDNPEASDSLVVQFLNPATQTWSSVWKATGTTTGDTVFNRVRISINDIGFRQNGFKFRFRNYGSLTGMLDIWHVDYVSLDKFLPPSFEDIRDFAFVYEGYSLLNNYSSVPWKHFASLTSGQQQAMVRSTANLTIRNNNESNPFPVKIAGTVFDQYGNSTPVIGGGGLNSIQIPLNSNVAPPATLNTNTFFTDPTTGEQATFTAVYELGQTSGGVVDDYPQNDTLKYVQDFHNYYAFDDGSAEVGYGLVGVGAAAAYKFDILKADTLRAIQMYFTQIGLSVTNQLFKLAVWSGSSTPVGAPVYQKFNQTPNYTDSINGFYTYLTDPVYITPGTWFFGFIQNNSVILNLGLDLNTPADPSRKLVNTTGSWTNSQLPGMWMIRPVFSSTPIDVGVDETELESSDLQVWPVPATQTVHVMSTHSDASNYVLSLSDVAGREVMQTLGANNTIDVSALRQGIYFLRIYHPVSGDTAVRKVVISRQ